eukprot:TRINITY_DN14987_c0_g1_i2.p1 TRINITY_DN14987_c0_g1~~TRINITY_DN14987_c0_g1_i2.p1  ORF type:complete len:318 (-),score=34.80 TRINITY_DN14987_c0_g1_i2:31-984(-)
MAASSSELSAVYSQVPPEWWRGRVLLFYKYFPVPDPGALVEEQRALCSRLGMTGRTRIAEEGINATYAGTVEAIEEYIETLQRDPRFAEIDFKTSPGLPEHFRSLEIHACKEILCMGDGTKHITADMAAPRLSPAEFHAKLLELEGGSKEIVLLDCRNEYEYKIGHFRNATVIPTRQFSDFPKVINAMAPQLKDKTVLMYCTGGVRCERGSALVKNALRDTDVFHLSGGIHRYLEQFPDGGLWEGRNLVFDLREALAPPKYTVVGHCDFCKATYDSYQAQARCQHCRVLMLVCDACRLERSESFVCSENCPALRRRG